jgi:hypothetical protein
LNSSASRDPHQAWFSRFPPFANIDNFPQTPRYTFAMKNMALVLLLGLVGVPGAVSQQQDSSFIEGYVTRVTAGSDFDVNGFRVLCGVETQNVQHLAPGHDLNTSGCPAYVPYLGEPFIVYGTKKRSSLRAEKIEPRPLSLGSVQGSAVIDAVPSSGRGGASPAEFLVRADGYQILLGGNIHVSWIPPLRAYADVRPGDWIEYRGKLGSDGVVRAEEARLSPNIVSKAEVYARSDLVHVAAIADPLQPDKIVLKYVALDGPETSFYADPAMQARVDGILKTLIPSFQKDLPDDDPRKINFRIQLTSDKKWNQVIPLPSGVILIPHQVVVRLNNDSQLAAVVADAVAFTMENEAFRMRGVVPGVAIASFAYLNPLTAPLLAWGAADYARSQVERIRDEQSDRVGLGLLHDAGYDIDQAPVAWWLLASRKLQPINNITMPERSANLYRILGEVWHNPAAPAF